MTSRGWVQTWAGFLNGCCLCYGDQQLVREFTVILENFQKPQGKFFEDSVPVSSTDGRNFLYDPRDVKSKTLPLSRNKFRLVCFCFLKLLDIIDTLIQSQLRGLLLGRTWQFPFLSWNQLCSGASHSLESLSLHSLAQEREPKHSCQQPTGRRRTKGKEALLSFPRGFSE